MDTLFTSPMDDQFAAFHSGHPEVYRLFCKFTAEVRAAGHRQYSADAILHRIRWEYDVNRGKDGGFKINNNFAAYYARMLMRDYPGFRGFFQVRRSRAVLPETKTTGAIQ